MAVRDVTIKIQGELYMLGLNTSSHYQVPVGKLPGILAASALAMLLMSTAAQAALIDVQFVSPGGNSADGTAGVAFSGAALTGTSGDQWNQISVPYGSMSLLVSNGSSSGISLS
jgi:hypothetical protein